MSRAVLPITSRRPIDTRYIVVVVVVVDTHTHARDRRLACRSSFLVIDYYRDL